MRRGGIAASPEEIVMSFNPLFTLLARGEWIWVEPSPDVIELGNQTLNADQRACARCWRAPGGTVELIEAGIEGLLAKSGGAGSGRGLRAARLSGLPGHRRE